MRRERLLRNQPEDVLLHLEVLVAILEAHPLAEADGVQQVGPSVPGV